MTRCRPPDTADWTDDVVRIIVRIMTAAEYERKLLANECKRVGCAAPAVDGSAFCALHRDDDRAYDRDRKAKKREAHPELCCWCLARKAVKRGGRCRRCIAYRPLKAVVRIGVRIVNERRKDKDGRMRNHGQGKRGRRPRTDDKRWVTREIERHVEAYKRCIAFEDSAEYKQLGQGDKAQHRSGMDAHLAAIRRLTLGPDVAEIAETDDESDDGGEM